MDLAIYIKELLGLHGKVNVPGIGYFSQIRINGYYNEHENKFYPPHHQVNFDPQLIENDELAKYIADKKNISLASSMYFVDKYVIGVKQQVATQKVNIAGLGYLYTEQAELEFKPNNEYWESEPSFYGLPPVTVYKNGEHPTVTYTPSVSEPAPVSESLPVTEDVPVNEDVHVIEDVSVNDVPEEILTEQVTVDSELVAPAVLVQGQTDYIYDEPEPKRSVNFWVIVLLIIIVAILAVTGIYINKPSLIDKYIGKQEPPEVVKTVPRPDTAIKSSPAKDSVAKTSPAIDKTQTLVTASQQPSSTPPDTNTRVHYEILGGAFGKLSEAETAIKNYHDMGFDARVLDVPGKKHKVTLGTYYSYNEAASAKKKLLSTGKIKEQDVIIQPYKPGKK
jgi:hypothetical protein